MRYDERNRQLQSKKFYQMSCERTCFFLPSMILRVNSYLLFPDEPDVLRSSRVQIASQLRCRDSLLQACMWVLMLLTAFTTLELEK